MRCLLGRRRFYSTLRPSVYIVFLPSRDEYMIVHILSDNHIMPFAHCEIFSSSSGSWNKISDVIFPIDVGPVLASGGTVLEIVTLTH